MGLPRKAVRLWITASVISPFSGFGEFAKFVHDYCYDSNDENFREQTHVANSMFLDIKGKMVEDIEASIGLRLNK